MQVTRRAVTNSGLSAEVQRNKGDRPGNGGGELEVRITIPARVAPLGAAGAPTAVLTRREWIDLVGFVEEELATDD